ncbi:MAG: family 1 glycosylhydrolase [Candidatus Omnitrophica bacterium]|nr:family 1 glycosylhydrolase [Candidatus Omnitrophota bacterium]
MQIQFPQSFFWGAALSSYQSEGGNFNSDWAIWEKEKNLQPAKLASDHYSRFREDFRLASQLRLNCLRLSFEWARIYPSRGVVAEEELAHYKEVIDALLALGIRPLVSLHHFTNPIWFAKSGGWLKSSNIDSFLEYVSKVSSAFKDKIEYWLVFNEPLVYIYNGFLRGNWPPGEHSLSSANKVLDNITACYEAAYQEIKRVYGSCPSKVSFSKHLRSFYPCPRFSFGLNRASASLRDRIFNNSLLERIARSQCMDFIAINYYCKEYVQFAGPLGKECEHNYHQERRNYMGWYVYPQGLYELLLRLKKFNLPIIITENGTAEEKNSDYKEYLFTHLKSIGRAISAGVDVRGYIWWSLIDNFEWDKGFSPRFGLIGIDYTTLERSIRPFALEYAEVASSNKLEI